MNKSWILSGVVGLMLAIGAGNASGGLINYWSFAQSNATGNTFADLVGSNPATNTTTNAYVVGASGTANAATTVTGPNGGGATGITTTLKQLGAGTAGSPWTLEFMYKNVSSPGYRWGYLLNRAGGPVGMNMGYSTNANKIGANVGATTVLNGPAWTPTANTWYDFAMTYDGSTLNLYITPYSPTVTAPTLFASYTGSTLAAISATVGLGFGTGDGSRYGVNGAFEWAAVYNTALTTADITSHIVADTGFTAPEPATMSVLVLGGIAVLVRRRRRA